MARYIVRAVCGELVSKVLHNRFRNYSLAASHWTVNHKYSVGRAAHPVLEGITVFDPHSVFVIVSLG